MVLLAPFAILVLAMLGLALCLWRRLPYAGLVAALGVGGAWLSALSWSFQLPLRFSLSEWPFAQVGAAGLVLRLDGLGWITAMAHLSLSLLIVLTGFARPGGQRIRVRMAALLLIYAGLAVFLAEDLLTRLFAWSGLDLIVFVVYALLARGEALPLQAVRQFSFNALASGLVILGVVIAQPITGQVAIGSASASPWTAILFVAAAAFRLGLFPFHVGVPMAAETRQGLAVLLRLVPALAGFEWLFRLTGPGFAPDVRLWITALGVIAAWVGSVQVWNSVTARDTLPSLVVAFSGIAALASQGGGLPALVPLALALTLGAGLLFLAHGFDAHRRWLTVFPAVGLAALTGVPGTPGFLVLTEMAGAARALSGMAWLVVGAGVVAWVVLSAGLWRVLVWPAEPLQGGRVGLGLHVGGLTLGVVLVLFTGVASSLLSIVTGIKTFELSEADAPNLIAAAGLSLIIVGLGFGLWRAENITRSALDQWSRTGVAALVGPALRWDGLFRLIWWILAGLSRLVGAGVAVLEGAGGPLWVLAFIVAVALAFRP